MVGGCSVYIDKVICRTVEDRQYQIIKTLRTDPLFTLTDTIVQVTNCETPPSAIYVC